ncbi:hypothetical protein [Actinophytocola sediminis]
MTEDQERLVAEALRAHAARTSLPTGLSAGPFTEASQGNGQLLSGYGLLSGSGVALPPPIPEPTVRDPSATEDTSRIDGDTGIAVGWILLLALLLGLAAGAVVGLVTLL